MTVAELMRRLEGYSGNLEIYISAPVEGDCENLRVFESEHLLYDARYPALVFFPDLVVGDDGPDDPPYPGYCGRVVL